jgi:hypothetical protein
MKNTYRILAVLLVVCLVLITGCPGMTKEERVIARQVQTTQKGDLLVEKITDHVFMVELNEGRGRIHLVGVKHWENAGCMPNWINRVVTQSNPDYPKVLKTYRSQ